MRVFKLALISLIAFTVLVLLFSLLFPAEVRISRAITIQATATPVVRQLSDMRGWQRWNEMVNNPELTGISVSLTTFLSDQLLIQLQQQDSIRHIWVRNGNRIPSGFNLIQSSGNETIVQWYFDFPVKWYPWEKFGSMVFDKQIGPIMERSLDNFKKLVEDSL